MPETQLNPLEVPLPPDPLREDFPEAEAYDYTPGEVLEDTFTVTHNGEEVSITVTVTGDAEYPSVVGGSEPEKEVPLSEVLWTVVWWARALGLPYDSTLRAYTWGGSGPAFRLGGLYRYADFPLGAEEVAE